MTLALVLGGTTEGRALARALIEAGIEVVYSTAGATQHPPSDAGMTHRRGGFGGVSGLVDWVTRHTPGVVVDATHPYAAQVTANCIAACAEVGVPLVRYERPSWETHPLSSTWTWVDTHVEAAALTVTPALLTVGGRSLTSYLGLRDVVARVVDPPTDPLPERWTLVRGRGPYDVAAERELLRRHGITTLVTKDSGGSDAKLVAAAALDVRIVMVRRPTTPDPATPNPAPAHTVAEALHLSLAALR